MQSEIRPVFEVVKEGRILHFVSGSRRVVVNGRIIQWIEPPRQAGPVKYDLGEGFSLFHRAGSFASISRQLQKK
jgi:hypothetical protein